MDVSHIRNAIRVLSQHNTIIAISVINTNGSVMTGTLQAVLAEMMGDDVPVDVKQRRANQNATHALRQMRKTKLIEDSGDFQYVLTPLGVVCRDFLKDMGIDTHIN